jgi:hypothetical protein
MPQIATFEQALSAVLDAIRRKAADEWPDDYVMQVHVVQQQTTVY